MRKRTRIVTEPNRFVRLPHEVVLSELRLSHPRYHSWLELYWALRDLRDKPPRSARHDWSLGSMVGTAFDRMLQLAGRDTLKWISFRLAVYQELKDRNLIDDEGRICP